MKQLPFTIFTSKYCPMPLRLTLLFLFALMLGKGHAQVFTLIKDQPPGLVHAAAVWVDVDGNGKKDLIVAGDNAAGSRSVPKTVFFKQTGPDKFAAVTKGLPDFTIGAIARGDLNKDGRQDVVFSGQLANGQYVAGVLLGQADGNLRKAEAALTPTVDGSLALADIDKDGDDDILLSGKDAKGRIITVIYRNDNLKFTEIDAGLVGIMRGKAAFGDINVDGFPDIIVCGLSANGPVTRLYLNNQGRFSSLTNHFKGLKNADAVFADLDNDKWPDLIISGENTAGRPATRLFKNLQNNMFAEVSTPGIRQLLNCTIDVADYDVDGDLDLVMTGESLERPYAIVYQNQGQFLFTDIMAGLPGVSAGTARWGDYDNDGDPDLFVSGLDVCYNFIGQIYRNNTNPEIIRDEPTDIFIESPIVDYGRGPYYYFLFSSCFCDPQGDGKNAYHMWVSNVHKEMNDFELNYKFNELLVTQYPNWGPADRGHRTSNAFVTAKEAEVSRLGVIESYKADNYQIHYFNW